MPEGEVWRPGSFSRDGRYLLLWAAETGAEDKWNAWSVVLDTETLEAVRVPSDFGVMDPLDASWLAANILWFKPDRAKTAAEEWYYYDAATAKITAGPCLIDAESWHINVSPDGRHAYVTVKVSSSPPGRFEPWPVVSDGFGPFKGLREGFWLFVFPVGG